MTSTENRDNRLQVRADDDLSKWLADRGARMACPSASLQARAELGLWRGIMAAELRRLSLPLAWANCLADVLNSTLLQPLIGSMPLAWMDAHEAFQIAREDDPSGGAVSGYGAKWGLDEQAMLGWLSKLSPAADHALRDAVSRWWETGQDATTEGWAAVGVRVS